MQIEKLIEESISRHKQKALILYWGTWAAFYNKVSLLSTMAIYVKMRQNLITFLNTYIVFRILKIIF